MLQDWSTDLRDEECVLNQQPIEDVMPTIGRTHSSGEKGEPFLQSIPMPH